MFFEENYNVLLIEDNPGDARLIKEYIQESNPDFLDTLSVEQSLQDGCESLRNNEYDLVLLDLSLPDSFGLETFEKVHEINDEIPIIVLTGLDDEKMGVEAVRLGAQDFLVKKELNSALLARSILYAIERNRLTCSLEEREESLKEAQKLAHLGNFELDLHTGVNKWSDELFRIFDMSSDEEEPLFEDLINFIHPADREDFVDSIKSVCQVGARESLEIRIITKTGNIRYLNNIINPHKNDKGEVVKLFGITLDITQRKMAEKQIRENERRYRTLFQATTDEILVFQLDQNRKPLPFLEVNSVACSMLNYSREELMQMTIYDIVAVEPEEVDKRIERVLQEGEAVLQVEHKTRDGEVIPLEINVGMVKYNGRNTIISIGRDVREQRKLQSEILNISEQERQRIGRDMHDSLGQMLSGIGLLAQNLANRLRDNELPEAKKAEEIARLIKEADQQARSLSRGLMPVSVESNGLAVALKELTEKISEIYNVDIRYSCDNSVSIEDNHKAVHLYRIAQEALSNSVRHAQATFIKIDLDKIGGHITLRIMDNGTGFSKSESRNDGLGLQTMRFRANMLGGQLEISSEEKEGTIITCRIPELNPKRDIPA